MTTKKTAFSSAEVARIVGISRQTLMAYITKEVVKPEKVSRQWVYKQSDIDRAVAYRRKTREREERTAV